MCRPDLLKIITFVLSMLIFKLFSIENVCKTPNMLLRPFSVFDKSKRSSAHIREPKFVDKSNSSGVFSGVSSFGCRSERNILKSNGLRIHPCFTP